MTQGTYTRCKEKGCRKKVAYGSRFCPAHKDMDRRRVIEGMKKSNPSMVELIEAIVDEKIQMLQDGHFSDFEPIKSSPPKFYFKQEYPPFTFKSFDSKS